MAYQNFIRFIFRKRNQMSFEEGEIQNSSTSQGKGRILGVIVLTDNRLNKLRDKSPVFDYRNSAFKETDVDPLQFQRNDLNYTQDDELIAELGRKVCDLEERVRALSNSEGLVYMSADSDEKKQKKKNRRKFKELIRDHMCLHCRKMYGSETSLKFHLKLKHSSQNQNHSQVL